mgnify:CR=1 FL=1
MSDDFMLDTDDLQRRMEGALASLRTEFASLRTGRASASMLEPVMVDAYEDEVQELTDTHIAKVDEFLNTKQEEIMQV